MKSIKRQFAFISIAVMAGTILLCWFLNTTFLERYYIQNKQQVLLKAYSSINEAGNAGNIVSEKFSIELQRVSGIYNIDMIVVDADSSTLVSTVNDSQILEQRLLDNFFLGIEKPEAVLEQTESYVVQNAKDTRTGINYIEMWGILDNGNLFMMHTPLEGIKDSAGIANRFLAYVGTLAAITSGIIIWFVAKKITNPVMELAKISEKMTHLDFEARYVGKDENEIGVLGNHINQLSDTLEKTISELKTANNELKKDIEKKEQADEIRKEFLSNVSHELKTPLALIMGYAEGLKADINENADSKEFYCDVIIDEADKMNVMVKKLLTLNQLEFGHDTITMERFDITELISNYISSAEILIKQKEVKVLWKEPVPLYVWGDVYKVEEVFMNYFTNALNYAEGVEQHSYREKKISIDLTPGEGVVRISVFNTGQPIPEESIPHLWEKFYKVDKARVRAYGGSGIGLSIVKAIMESMNRKYGVNNYENGVEFWFELETN